MTSSATHATMGRWATECLAFLRRGNSLQWGGPWGSTPYSPLSPGGLGFLASPPVPHCPGRDRTKGTDESSTQRVHGFHRIQAGKLRPGAKK